MSKGQYSKAGFSRLHWRRITLALAGFSGATLIAAASAPADAPLTQLPMPPRNGEMGFVFTVFAPAIFQGKNDCPNGLAGTVKENFLAGLPATERDRLKQKENEEELTRLWKASTVGPAKTNICTNPEAFYPRRLQPTVQGQTSYGLDLDDDASGQPSEGCAHENFTGPDGTTGIDNQLYRALGCLPSIRGAPGVPSEGYTYANSFLPTGEWTVVMLLRKVDSLAHDDEVEVILSNTDDRPYLDSQRNFITGTSFTITGVPKWRNVLKGRIRDGVLTTEAKDILLTQRFGVGGDRAKLWDQDYRRARLRLHFRPDGSIEGLLGGYQLPRTLIQIPMAGGVGTATGAGLDCATQLYTMERLADGIRDQKTGKCTALSSAMHVTAVPAFINDRGAVPPHISEAR